MFSQNRINKFLQHSSRNGQALLEFILVLPLFMMFLWGIIFTTRLFIRQIELNQLARYSIWLIVHANYKADKIKETIINRASFTCREEDIELDMPNFNNGSVKVNIQSELPLPPFITIVPGIPTKLGLKGYAEVYDNTWMVYPYSSFSHS